MKVYCIFFIVIACFYTQSHSFTQRIHNNSDQPADGKIIYRPLLSMCKHQDFAIRPHEVFDINTRLCLVKEITVGSGPAETFVLGKDLKGWNNTLYLNKTDKGPWQIRYDKGIH